MTLRQRLEGHLSKFPTAPFLFVGSGISRRYLNLENWEGLLRQFAALTDKPYEYYRSTAGGHLPSVATLISRRFHEKWWQGGEFAASRATHQAECSTESSALKIEISQALRERSKNFPSDETLKKEVDLLRQANVDGVISTNWDLFLEEIFPEYRVFVGQEQLLFSEPQAVGEIYKIHGCASRPNSLVLTKEDYERFNERNPYLAAKLLAIFVEHPVIFLGYSLNDENVVEILRSIASCLTSANIAQLQDRLIFVQWDPSEPDFQMTATTIVTGGFAIPIVAVRTATFTGVFEALASTQRKFPARLLRQLKKHVYDLVLTHDARKRLYVQEIDAEADISELEVVFGVGSITQKGYRAIARDDLLRDIVFHENKYDARKIVEETLPTLLKGATFVPVFKYLRELGLKPESELEKHGLDKRVVDAARASRTKFDPPNQYQKKRQEVDKLGLTIASMRAKWGEREVLYYGALIPDNRLVVKELRDYLAEHPPSSSNYHAVELTQYAKLVCLLDYMENNR